MHSGERSTLSRGAATLRCVVVTSLFRGARGQSPCATYEAEDAAASGPNLMSNHEGFTGAGFMDYDAATEDFLEWTVAVHPSQHMLMRVGATPSARASRKVATCASV